MQRADVTGRGVPGTSCAPDLFSRFDALVGIPGADANSPVAIAMGFRNGKIGQYNVAANEWQNVRKGSFAASLITAQWPLPSDPWYTRGLKWISIALTLCYVWGRAWLADVLVSTRSAPEGCDPDALKMVSADIAYKQLVSKLAGGDPEWVTKVDVYARNYLCPTVLMTAGDAVSGYLADVLTEDELDDYARANGLCSDSASVLWKTARTRISAVQADTLYRRGLLPELEWRKALRQLGWLYKDDVDNELLSSERWPELQELFVRAGLGVYDQGQRQNFQLDADDGWMDDPIVKQRIKALGHVDGDVKDAWAGHWIPLDVQTAIELYNRSTAGLLPDGVSFGDDDLRAAIRQSNVLPVYRKAIESTARVLPQRRILLQQLEYQAITRDQAKQYLIASGLSNEDADGQLAAWQPVIDEFRRKRIGASGVGGYLGMFAAGTIGTTELGTELLALGLNAQEVSDALDEARAQRSRKTRAALIQFIHGRFVKGDVSEAQVTGVLSASGLDGEDVANLLGLWRIELEVSPKQISVAEMLDWHCRGIIDDDELTTRLAQLKYSMADIARMVAVGDYKCMVQEQAEAEKLLSRVKGKLTAAQASWSKTLATVSKQVGTVQQRTKTRAGNLLSVIKSQLEGSPPPAKSLAGRASAILAKGATNGAANAGATVATGATTPTTGASSGGGGSTGGSTMAEAPSPPVIPEVVTAPASQAQPAPTAEATQSLGAGSGNASETPPA